MTIERYYPLRESWRERGEINKHPGAFVRARDLETFFPAFFSSVIYYLCRRDLLFPPFSFFSSFFFFLLFLRESPFCLFLATGFVARYHSFSLFRTVSSVTAIRYEEIVFSDSIVIDSGHESACPCRDKGNKEAPFRDSTEFRHTTKA